MPECEKKIMDVGHMAKRVPKKIIKGIENGIDDIFIPPPQFPRKKVKT